MLGEALSLLVEDARREGFDLLEAFVVDKVRAVGRDPAVLKATIAASRSRRTSAWGHVSTRRELEDARALP